MCTRTSKSLHKRKKVVPSLRRLQTSQLLHHLQLIPRLRLRPKQVWIARCVVIDNGNMPHVGQSCGKRTIAEKGKRHLISTGR